MQQVQREVTTASVRPLGMSPEERRVDRRDVLLQDGRNSPGWPIRRVEPERPRHSNDVLWPQRQLTRGYGGRTPVGGRTGWRYRRALSVSRAGWRGRWALPTSGGVAGR